MAFFICSNNKLDSEKSKEKIMSMYTCTQSANERSPNNIYTNVIMYTCTYECIYKY